MNDIKRFLELEDPSITIEDISIEGHVKTIKLSTPPKSDSVPRLTTITVKECDISVPYAL